MSYLTERNERSTRHSALTMAILLHLGLAAALYLATTQEPAPRPTPTPVKKIEQPHPASPDGRTASN